MDPDKMSGKKKENLEKVFQQVEKEEGGAEQFPYLVRGAELCCTCGTHKRKINLPLVAGTFSVATGRALAPGMALLLKGIFTGGINTASNLAGRIVFAVADKDEKWDCIFDVKQMGFDFITGAGIGFVMDKMKIICNVMEDGTVRISDAFVR